jgi:outer membrane translocation and assembly module TamA
VPVKITVIERPQREVGLALGYGTDDGAAREAPYRDRNLFARGFDLQSSMRVAQKRSSATRRVPAAGPVVHAQRGDIPFTDSFGVLAEHNVIENLAHLALRGGGLRHCRSRTSSCARGCRTRSSARIPRARECA